MRDLRQRSRGSVCEPPSGDIVRAQQRGHAVAFVAWPASVFLEPHVASARLPYALDTDLRC
jgi:hypothetical protein